MNLASLDLNLLVALDALLLEGNVGRAGMRIGLSQPAASHALRRLRDILGDPLLVRVGARMELTPRALALRGPLAQALDQVRGLFIPDDFDAARSERHFRLMMPDLAVELLMPPLMEKIAALAPNVRLDIVPWRGPAIVTAEFARTIDLVISIGDAFKGFHRQLLYTDSDALAVRRSHPAGAKLRRRDAFLNARHVAVVIRGQSADLIDDWLRPKGIERRIALVVPGYIWSATSVRANGDGVAGGATRRRRARRRRRAATLIEQRLGARSAGDRHVAAHAGRRRGSSRRRSPAARSAPPRPRPRASARRAGDDRLLGLGDQLPRLEASRRGSRSASPSSRSVLETAGDGDRRAPSRRSVAGLTCSPSNTMSS